MLTITNGSAMPISPGVVFSADEKVTKGLVGGEASNGLITLCKSGNPDLLVEELKMKMGISNIQKIGSPTLPGASAQVMLKVGSLEKQNLRFLAMYGKTIDACSVIDISSFDLIHAVRLNHGVRGVDQVISTGAFSDPVVPEFLTSYCESEKDAVSCLRMLSMETTGGKIRFFRPYLPSVVNFLENKYGAEDVLSLSLNNGNVSFELKRGD